MYCLRSSNKSKLEIEMTRKKSAVVTDGEVYFGDQAFFCVDEKKSSQGPMARATLRDL
jgi:hypothetical protein